MKTLNETLQPREVNATFENSIFKIILMLVHENCCTSMQFSLKFVPACLSNIQSGIIPGNSLTLNRRQDIIWTNDSLAYWHIYASLGFDEYTPTTGFVVYLLHALII